MASARQHFSFWRFLLTGTAAAGFDPAQGGLEGIKNLVRKRFPEVRQLSVGELAAWLVDLKREQPILLDAREPDEFTTSHLPGALQVDPSANAESIRPLLTANRPVVVYCSVGYRSSGLARRLTRAGVTEVFNLEGSIFEWANEGRPLAGANGPATRVHPYRDRWGALLKPEVRGQAR